MPELQAVADYLVSSGLPILLVDTCSVLDIVRSPLRNMTKAELQAALFIAEAAIASPPQCSIVRSSLIEKEFQDHIDDTKEELKREITKLTDKIACLDAAADYFSVTRMGVAPVPELADHLDGLAKKIVAACLPIDEYVNAQARAHQRVIEPRVPAQQGKQSYKDCVIFEEYLDLARCITEAGSGQKVVFLTSNKNDYGSGTSVHPDITSASEAVGLTVCFIWTHARYVLFG